jgi:tRNA A-37 threonylcarbamoyl transferase component Bud32
MAEADQTPRRYDLLERIAVGGMAEIFRAKAYGAHGFEKTLAIKRILPDLARDAEFENRFIAEAKLAVALTHANVVQIFDFGRFAGSLYIAMEYVDGPDLGRVLKTAAARDESVPLGAAMHIAMEMCKGLDVAHARRVVHSDISPSNILLSRLGEVKIADFGIARAAADGAARKDKGAPADRVMGKWPYMSPEQTRGEPLDARSDVFSAAVVMYELFTCESLFRGRDVESIVERVRSMPIPPASSKRSSLPPALDEVLARALERDPARRFQQASDLLRALLEVSYSHTLVATSMDVADAIRRWFPPAQEPSAAAPVDADALIREQLPGDGGTVGGRARVTERAATPAMSTPVPEPVRPGESQRTEALPGSRGRKVTFVRGEQGTDGIPVWELTIAGDPGVVPPAPAMPPPAPSRRRAAISGALALVLAGAAAWGAMRVTRAAAPVVGALRVESLPAGAQILLDGKILAQATPTTIEVPDPQRARRLELRLPGYRPWQEASVVLKPGERAFYRPQLEALSTRLIVRTEPAGAEVALDGRTIGRTPISNQAVPADGHTHQLRLRRHGFSDVTEAVQLVDGTDVVVDRALTKVAPAPRFGTIDLHVDPWALVYLDGRKIGEAPVRGLSLPLGRHRLKLVNPVQRRQMTLNVEVPAKHAYRVKLPAR